MHIVAVSGVQYRFFGKKAGAQKARKLGLLGLSASFPYMNSALLKRWVYVFFRVLSDGFLRGKNPDLCTLLHRGLGENGLRFAEEWQSKDPKLTYKIVNAVVLWLFPTIRLRRFFTVTLSPSHPKRMTSCNEGPETTDLFVR